MTTLPFSTTLDANNPDGVRPVQLRLAMFRRANPGVSWKPLTFGTARSKDVDGQIGTRSWDALQSYIDFRFGPGVVTTYKNKPGLSHTLVLPQIMASLAADTPYADDPIVAAAYYNQIQSGNPTLVPALPPAKAGVLSVACSASPSSMMAGFGSADGLSWNDQDSIFGRTYQGVPNPQIPFQHSYPTRYHGPIFNIPRFGMPFQSNPMAVAPFAGTDGLGALTDPLSQAAAQALAASLQPIITETIRSTMPEIVSGVKEPIDEAVDKATMRVAIGGGIVAAGLAALIILRTGKGR